MKVQCINAGRCELCEPQWDHLHGQLVRGRYYTVIEIDETGNGFVLAELPIPPGTYWCRPHFAEVRRATDLSFLKQRKPEYA